MRRKALAELGPVAKDAVPELLKHFDAKNLHLRLFSAEAAARIDAKQAPKAVEVLVTLLTNEKRKVSMIRSYSLVALQHIGTPAKDAMPALVPLLTDDGPFHVDVALAMIAIDPDGAKPAFDWMRKVLDKNDPDDGYELVERLPELGVKAKAILPELMKMLQAKTVYYRDHAIQTLAAIGPDAKDAIPELKKLAEKDPVKRIRERAAEAIKKIEAK